MILKVISLLLKLMEGRRMITEAKKRGILFYLRVLQAVRLSAVGVLGFIFIFQIFFFSFIGLVGSGLYLSPLETETKIWIIFYLCLGIVLIFAAVLGYVFSEKTWYRHSGVENIINK